MEQRKLISRKGGFSPHIRLTDYNIINKTPVVRETKCTIAEVNAPVLMRWQFCRCFISFKEAQLLEFGMIFLGGFGIFYEDSA